MKKFSRYILIIILLESFVWTTQVNAQTGSVILPNNVNSTTQTVSDQRGTCVSNGQTFTNWTRDACVKNSNNAVWTGYYYFLQPLPGVGVNDNSGSTTNGVMFDPTNKGSQSTSLGSYLNPMITAFIGICAILAFVMIVIGGIEYMTSELPGNKSDGKDRITNAIFGLLLALGAWTILNTINPNLLNSDISTPNANVSVNLLDQANLAKSDQTVSSVGSGYKTNAPSAGVAAFAQSNCSSLNNITVNTANKQASFCANSNCVTVPINVGYNGVAQPGTAQGGDSKTPIGTYKLGSKSVASGGSAVVSNGYNFGAAFVNIGVTDSNGVNRGIGFHGNATDTLGTTNGCVRMTNDDLSLLAPCMQTGTQVTIQ